MKWYWAISITIGMMFVPFVLLMNGAPENSVDTLITAMVAISAIYAGVSSGSFGWGLFVFLLWPIGSPAFLVFTQPPETKEDGLPRLVTEPHPDHQESFSDLDVYRSVNRGEPIEED